jgi:hypothetical protein
MKKMILANLKEFFENGTFKPFQTLADLEHEVLSSSNLIPTIEIHNCIFTLKGMKHNDGEQVIIYTFQK